MCSSSSAGHEAGEGAGAAAEVPARAAGEAGEVQRAGKSSGWRSQSQSRGFSEERCPFDFIRFVFCPPLLMFCT